MSSRSSSDVGPEADSTAGSELVLLGRGRGAPIYIYNEVGTYS